MTKLKDLEWFCPQPFTNTVSVQDGSAKPCCVVKEWPSSQLIREGIIGPKALHESQLMKDFRKEFLTGGGPLTDFHCQVCKEQEKHSATESHRLMYLDKFDKEHGEHRKHLEKLEEYIDTDYNEPWYLTMEYNAPNNFCNLKCNMCGPYNSSAYARETKAIGMVDAIGVESVKHATSTWLKDRTWVNEEDDMTKFEEVLETAVQMKLVGGETLALPQNYKMMDKAIEMGVAKNMELTITTNATLTPKMGKLGDIFNYVPEFKCCQMNISVECWGDKNNYIRFPSKWEKIMENVERFSKMPNTKILFATCISSLNIGYLNEVADGVDSLIEREPDIYNNFACSSLVVGMFELYTVTAIPLDIREQYLDRIYTLTKPHHTKTFMKLANYLTDMEWDEERHKKMMIDVAKRDKYRGTVLTDVFPEWDPYYKKL